MTAPIVHGGGITGAAALYGGREDEWLDLSTGINPSPPAIPPIGASAWHRLPDRSLERSAREAARGFYRSGAVLPLAVPGTQSVIQLLPRLVDKAKRIAIFGPTYGEYERAFRAAGFAVDIVASAEEITRDHGLVVLVNPNNPDGRVFSPDRILALAATLSGRGAILVVDEAFGDCTPELSVAPMAANHENLLVFRSFGKFFGMAGLRLGFVIAPDGLLTRFADWLGPWAVSGPAFSVAAGLLGGDGDAIRETIGERGAALDRVLQDAGLHVRGRNALFQLVEHPSAAALHDHLCRHHILTRRFDYAPGWLRFGLAPDSHADARLATALSDWAGR